MAVSKLCRREARSLQERPISPRLASISPSSRPLRASSSTGAIFPLVPTNRWLLPNQGATTWRSIALSATAQATSMGSYRPTDGFIWSIPPASCSVRMPASASVAWWPVLSISTTATSWPDAILFLVSRLPEPTSMLSTRGKSRCRPAARLPCSAPPPSTTREPSPPPAVRQSWPAATTSPSISRETA